MAHQFEVRMYTDVEDKNKQTLIIEVSQIRDVDTLVLILNFLERIRYTG